MVTLSDLESAIDLLLNHPLGTQQYQLIQRVEDKHMRRTSLVYVFARCAS